MIKKICYIFKIIFSFRLSLYKRYNFMLQLLERYLFKKTKLISKPHFFTIEATTYCNLRCSKCIHGEKNSYLTKGILSYENFKIIFDKIKRYAIVISFANWGEPFLNKDVFKMIKTCKEDNIITNISSNLNFTNPKIAEEIVLCGLGNLFVSIDGASQESYEKYRVGGSIKQALDNIGLIQEYKKAHKCHHPKIVWTFLVNRHNEHEMEMARDLAKELGADIYFSWLRPTIHKEVFMSDEEKYQDLLDWFPQTSDISYQKMLENSKPRSCLFPWTTGIINFDGGVYPCCVLTKEKYYFGNLIDEEFQDIWNNELFLEARRTILGKERGGENSVCLICRENNFILLTMSPVKG